MAMVVASTAASAETLRITSWNLASPAASSVASTNDPLIQMAAPVLRGLAPDIVLLQNVQDWRTCANLAKALQPVEYSLVVCSSFRPGLGAAANRNQVAILSRQKAYFSWSEAWRAEPGTGLEGGYAFAAMQLLGKQRIGVFSAHLDALQLPSPADQAPEAIGRSAESFARQLLKQADSARQWQMNQVQTVLVVNSFDMAPRLSGPLKRHAASTYAAAGLSEALPQLERAPAITGKVSSSLPATATEEFFLDSSVFASSAQATTAPGFAHAAITWDIELDPAKVASLYTQQAEVARAAAQAAATSDTPPANLWKARSLRGILASAWFWLSAAVFSSLTLFAAALWFRFGPRATRRHDPRLLPEGLGQSGSAGGSYTVVLSPHAMAAPAAEGTGLPAPVRPLIQFEAPGATQTQSAVWQQRAIAAEQRADQANARLRQRLLPHLRSWLKQTIFRKLMTDRTRLLESQHSAIQRARSVDERLSRLEVQIQQQNRAYEQRIEALTCELVAAKEENRELIRARISQVRAEMESARARMMAQAKAASAPESNG